MKLQNNEVVIEQIEFKLRCSRSGISCSRRRQSKTWKVTQLVLRGCGTRSVTIWMCDLPLPRTMEHNCWLRLCSTGSDKNCLRQNYGLERKIIPNFVGVSNPPSRCMTGLFQATSSRDPDVISSPHSRLALQMKAKSNQPLCRCALHVLEIFIVCPEVFLLKDWKWDVVGGLIRGRFAIGVILRHTCLPLNL